MQQPLLFAMNNNPQKGPLIIAGVMLAVSLLIPLIALASSKWVFTSGLIVLFVLFGVFALASLGVLIAVLNRRIELHDDDFTYRTWLGNKHTCAYRDVIWYRETEHDLWLHMRDRRFIIDSDFENSAEMVKKLKSLGIPDYDFMDAEGVCDDNGEQAEKVLYLDQHKAVTWIMLISGALMLALGIFLLLYIDPSGDTMLHHPVGAAFWMMGTLLFSGMFFYYALRAKNTRVELYRDHFIYRNTFGRTRSYSYRDCVSSRERRFYNRSPLNPKIRFVAKLKMKDGCRLYVDDRIIEDGLGAPIGYHKLSKNRF